MKKNLYLVMLASAFLAGCQSEDLVQSGANQNLKTMEITAGMGELDSRTSYTDGGVKWQAGDALSVFVGNNTNYKFTIKEGIGENEAKFEGQAAASITYPNCVAYYPYAEDVTLSYKDKKYTLDATFPAVQQYAAGGSFGRNALPMVAVNETNEVAESFQFKKLGGWLQLYVKGNATITKVVMKAKGHKIAGNYTVTAAYGVTPTVAMADDAVSYISLNCGEGVVLNNEEATLFTFAVAPFTFGAGEVSFDIYDNQGTFMPNAFTIEKGATILSNAVYRLGKSNNVAYQGVKPVAKIGEIAYASLQAALEDVEDGQTITLLDDVTVTEAAYGQNALNYAKAVSCTIDLNEKTLSANTGNSVFRFNISAVEDVTTDVTVTMKNGKVIAGSDTWCAVMAAGKAENAKAIFNLEDLTIENSKPGDLAVKSWGNAVITAKNVTVNSTSAAGGFYALGGEMILENCTVEQKGLHTAPYLSMAFAVSNGGKMTINSGNYSSEPTADSEGYNQGTSHGSWVGGVMNSGGTLIINDGTFTNGNYGDDEQATAARGLLMVDTGAKLEINDGTFHALKGIIDYQNNLGDAANNPVVTIKGGSFNADPFAGDWVNAPEGYVAVEEEGTWNVIECASGVMIGSTPYESLQAAFDATQEDETVTLYANVSLEEPVTLTAERTVTLDLAGYTITAGSDGYVFYNGNGEITGSTLTINDEKNTGVINGIVYTEGGCETTINGGTYNAKEGAQFVLLNCGTLTINGGIVNGGSSYPVYSYNEGHKLVINDVTVNGTFGCINAYGLNGSVEINDGTFQMTGIQGKTSHIAYFANGDVTIKGGTFEKLGDIDMSSAGGGGICAIYGAALTIEGGSFAGDYADVYNWGGTNDNGRQVAISLEGGTFKFNPKTLVTKGYEVIENENGTFSVAKMEPVAKIGDKEYYTLQEAFNNVVNGETIILYRDVKQADGIIITNKNITIDLNDKTFTVSEGASTNNRNFKIDGSSVVTIKNGTMVAAGDYSSGAYGTVRTEGTANVTLENVKLYNYRGNGLNVKALSGTTVTINNSEVYSEYGGGIEAAGGVVELTNVKVEQKGMYTAPYNSMAISVNGGGTVTVNSGTYTTECITAEEANGQGTSHGPWAAGVLNSGGMLIIKGGTFSNDNFGDNSLATYARGLLLADTGANIQIEGGNFNALKNIIDIQNNLGDASKNPSVTLSGGDFSTNPLTWDNLIKVVEGYEAKQTEDGTWTVSANQ